MPTNNVKESACFLPGKLIRASRDIYSAQAARHPAAGENNSNNTVRAGTPGLIIRVGKKPKLGQDYYVEFLGMEAWWVYPNEIEPHP
jgi:hypothetical protein